VARKKSAGSHALDERHPKDVQYFLTERRMPRTGRSATDMLHLRRDPALLENAAMT